MRIKVTTHGHQHYSERTGEVVLWCTAVEHYDGKAMQVPAVLLKDGAGVDVVTLQRALFSVQIEVLEND